MRRRGEGTGWQEGGQQATCGASACSRHAQALQAGSTVGAAGVPGGLLGAQGHGGSQGGARPALGAAQHIAQLQLGDHGADAGQLLSLGSCWLIINIGSPTAGGLGICLGG